MLDRIDLDSGRRFWSTALKAATPYTPGKQTLDPGVIKLNTNESPYGPSPRVAEAMASAAGSDLRLYPDPECDVLRHVIARHHGVPASCVYVGNGSDEVLAFAFAGLLRQAQPLRFPDITYGFYPVYCGFFDIAFETIPLDEAYRIDLSRYLAGDGPVVLPNPNAPTGICLSLEEIIALLDRHTEHVIVIDEAYIDFGGESAAGLVMRYPNLLVVRTMSKARGLAGLRVGYALGDPCLIAALRCVRDCMNSYPVGLLAQVGAIASLEDEAYHRQTVERIVASRNLLEQGLRLLDFEVVPSSANFVLARRSDRTGKEWLEALAERGILVRRFEAERISNHLRITVGTDDQVRLLLSSLAEILAVRTK